MARYLKVAPWALAKQPADWLVAGQILMAAEAGARAERQMQDERRSRAQGGGR